MVWLRWFLSILLLVNYSHCGHETVSQVNEEKYSLAKDRRYLLYDVNPGEGFNLRRDVYMRIANLVRQLREKGENFVLVLPPWGGLYHWQSNDIGDQVQIEWSRFFDLESLNRFVPVIEFRDFLKHTGKPEIDLIYYLQHYAEGWGGKWEEKWHYRPCNEADRYYRQDDDGLWEGWFWSYRDIRAKRLECISVQGQSNTLLPLILQKNNTYNSVMVERGETIMHDYFGDKWYWRARRSMRFAKHLRDIADEFRKSELNSDDKADGTVLDPDWTKMKVKPGQATGGAYLAVHLRRKDFVRAHAKDLPSIKGAAMQIDQLLKNLSLHTVFLATDAPIDEIRELESQLEPGTKLKRFIPSKEMKHKYKDGGVAIIDQWIAAHARYFTGSHSSTFSYRIADEREILGFDPDTSFNRLCPDDDTVECEQPAQWTLVQD